MKKGRMVQKTGLFISVTAKNDQGIFPYIFCLIKCRFFFIRVILSVSKTMDSYRQLGEGFLGFLCLGFLELPKKYM